MKINLENHEILRRECWLQTYAASVSSGESFAASDNADQALKKFDSKFPNDSGNHTASVGPQ